MSNVLNLPQPRRLRAKDKHLDIVSGKGFVLSLQKTKHYVERNKA